MTAAIIVAVVLWLVLSAYAVTGGPDFGGGIWELLARGNGRAAVARELIQDSVGPVWEANHVWLIVAIVVSWTAFPLAAGAVWSTLFVPLSLAVLGIVLRGAAFAFRKALINPRLHGLAGFVFGVSSLLTPFFFGASVGAIATGRVHPAGAAQRLSSWTSPTSILLGVLAVSAFAYLAAVYLSVAARRRHEFAMQSYFVRRAFAAAVSTGGLTVATLVVLHGSAPRTFHRLIEGSGLPLVIVSVVLGVAALALLASGRIRLLRPVSAGAFVAVIWGWGVAQYPRLLPGSLTLRAAAGPTASLITELVIVGLITLLVVPSFLLLYSLAQRDLLTEDELNDALVLPPAAVRGGGAGAVPGSAAGARVSARERELGTVMLVVLAALAWITGRGRG